MVGMGSSRQLCAPSKVGRDGKRTLGDGRLDGLKLGASGLEEYRRQNLSDWLKMGEIGLTPSSSLAFDLASASHTDPVSSHPPCRWLPVPRYRCRVAPPESDLKKRNSPSNTEAVTPPREKEGTKLAGLLLPRKLEKSPTFIFSRGGGGGEEGDARERTRSPLAARSPVSPSILAAALVSSPWRSRRVQTA